MGLVCIDGTPLDNNNRFRGIGSYVSGLMKGFADCNADNGLCQLRIKGKGLNDPHGIESVYIHRPTWIHRRLSWTVNAIKLTDELAHLGVKLFHSTTPEDIAVGKKFKTISTIYDLIPLIYSRDYLEGVRGWMYRPEYFTGLRAYRKADHIITISNAVKLDIVKFLNISPEKISVIPLGYDKELFSPWSGLDVPRDFPTSYFLYVGAHDPRKNIELFLKAYRMVRKDLREKLVFVGRLSNREISEFSSLITKYNLSKDIINLGYVSSEFLPTLYRNASALVFPSLYEGFGLPVLEAMACGCPVIASNAGSIPEVVGDSGMLFDPNDASILAAHLGEVSNNQSLRSYMSKKGIVQAESYSWLRCAEQTLSVYKTVLSN